MWTRSRAAGARSLDRGCLETKWNQLDLRANLWGAESLSDANPMKIKAAAKAALKQVAIMQIASCLFFAQCKSSEGKQGRIIDWWPNRYILCLRPSHEGWIESSGRHPVIVLPKIQPS